MIKKEKVIILNTHTYSDSDLIIKAINSEGALLSFIAKGAKRSKKRFPGGVLEPTHFIDCVYKESKREGGLAFLNEANLLDGFPGIRDDYDKIEFAMYVLKTIEKISQEGECGSESLFNIIGNTLKAVETTENIKFLRLFFESKVLKQQGVIPEELAGLKILNYQIRNHNQIASEIKFDINDQASQHYAGKVHKALNEYLAR